MPNSTWNYAIKLTDDGNPGNDLKYTSVGLKPGVPPFSNKGAPSMITATVSYKQCVPLQWYLFLFLKGRVLDGWGLEHNAAAPPPSSPVSPSGAEVGVTLLPFGATDLRIAEIPTYK